MPSNVSGLYFFWISPYLDAGLTILLVLLAGIPSVDILLDELNSRYLFAFLNRSQLNAYVRTLLLRVIIISSLVPLIGILIYSIFIMIKFPLINSIDSYLFVNSIETLVNGHLLHSENYIFFYLLLLLNIIFYHLFFVISSILASVFVNNKYIIYIFPTIIYTVGTTFINDGKLSIFYNPVLVFSVYNNVANILQDVLNISKSSFLIYIYPTIFFIILCIVIYVLTYLALYWKIRSSRI